MKLKLSQTKSTLLMCLYTISAMITISYCCATAYKQFCTKTGYAGATKRASEHNNSPNDTKIKVRFVANTAENLPWLFRPNTTEAYVCPGEVIKTSYFAKNLANRPSAGEATYNVTPHTMGKYFIKLQCFCFAKICIKPLEETMLPLVFYIDSKVNADESANKTKAITLTYNMGLAL
ncbi:Cytochrome c oxidase assembly protein CtaG [Candidatus Hodgkinia cicadicola]|nr:Cytochrome c oxidase assembly protein CtaG [Candidatus Hodgkinia cicadicola]